MFSVKSFLTVKTLTVFQFRLYLLQLSKVNSVTLADWLKKRGVAVKTKDKKAELASKVRQYLTLIQHEQ